MKSELLLEQINQPDFLDCVPFLGEPNRNQEVLRRFSQGESCSSLAKAYGVTQRRINETLSHIVKKGHTFLSFIALCRDPKSTEDLIRNAPDLCAADRDILLRLLQEQSMTAVAGMTKYSASYVYIVLNRFFKVTKDGYKSQSEANQRIGKKLILLRKNAGLSVKEAAERAHISVRLLAHYESGCVRQDISNLMKLAHAYSVTLDDVSD